MGLSFLMSVVSPLNLLTKTTRKLIVKSLKLIPLRKYSPVLAQLRSLLQTQHGCRTCVRLASNWTNPGFFSNQIWVHFGSAEIWSEKLLGLSHLRPIWPTLNPNLTPLTHTTCDVNNSFLLIGRLRFSHVAILSLYICEVGIQLVYLLVYLWWRWRL